MSAVSRKGRAIFSWPRICCSLFCVGMWASSTLWAQSLQWAEAQLPTPVTGDGASGDNFGIAIGVEGQTVVVGAYGDTAAAADATFGIAQGSAYVFTRSGSGWAQTQKLDPQPTGEDGDNFGVAISMVDGFLAIGAPRRRVAEVPEAGSVFVYEQAKTGYVLRQLITPEVSATDQRFGTSTALWQEWMAIGVPQAGAGRVDIYRRDGVGLYQFEQSLQPNAAVAGDRFGAALAMLDGQLLIGAPNTDGTGALYRSKLAGNLWSAVGRVPLVATSGSELGSAIAASDGLALIGAPGAGSGEVRQLSISGSVQQVGVVVRAGGVAGDRFGSALTLDASRALIAAGAALLGEGAVVVYSRFGQNLTQMSQIDIDDGGTSNHFGVALALAADGLLVGADLDRVESYRRQGSVRWYSMQGHSLSAAGQLDSGNGAMFDRYGTSVAVDADTAIVGAFLEDTDAGADAGAAHWFQRSGSNWVYGGVLLAPDAAIEDRFGVAVAIDGDCAVVGAFWDVIGNNVDQGSVYVYRRQAGQWLYEAKLTASDGRTRDLFGFAVSVHGSRILVGARGAAVPFVDQGRAYLYKRSNGIWTEETQFNLPEANSFTYFGASVALTADRAIIGAPGFTKTGGPLSAGGVFVQALESGSWVPLSGLQAPIAQTNGAYGYSVAADQERVLVGAFQQGSAAQGAAYVYRASDLQLEAELIASTPQIGAGVGISVSISGEAAVLGASGFDLGSDNNQGSAHLFQRGNQGWRETTQWLALDGKAGDGFGRAVAMDANSVVIGAPGRGVDNPLEGAAYVVALDSLFSNGFE